MAAPNEQLSSLHSSVPTQIAPADDPGLLEEVAASHDQTNSTLRRMHAQFLLRAVPLFLESTATDGKSTPRGALARRLMTTDYKGKDKGPARAGREVNGWGLVRHQSRRRQEWDIKCRDRHVQVCFGRDQVTGCTVRRRRSTVSERPMRATRRCDPRLCEVARSFENSCSCTGLPCAGFFVVALFFALVA